MKLLYVGSNPATSANLGFDKEITELQRNALGSSMDKVDIAFQPNLAFEDIPLILHQYEPDIVHIAAHGRDDRLVLASRSGAEIALTPSRLATFLSDKRPPQLIYLNACDSQGIAKEIVEFVPMAIGSTALITNGSARSAAIAFYQRVFDGSSVGRAFDVCKAMLEGTADDQASVVLHKRPELDPYREFLRRVPRLIAEFDMVDPRRNRDGSYEVRFGVDGCPSGTRQVIFFTDDDRFETDDPETTLEDELSEIQRGRPTTAGIMWSEEFWNIVDGDVRFYAVGVNDQGQNFVVSAMLSEALSRRYRPTPSHNMSESQQKAINEIRLEG
nr:CHAT domain-containing protein [Mesorhizobium sp. LNHC220B00]